MRLKSISYIEFRGEPQEWRIDSLALGPRNLLVGKNASGKSRSLAIIGALARCVSGLMVLPISGEFIAEFDCVGDVGVDYRYEMVCLNGGAIHERLLIDGREYLIRGADGIGKMVFEKINSEELIDFQTPPTSLAAFARRDSIQHPYLELLAAWANSLRFYHFAYGLGKSVFALFAASGQKVDDRDETAVVALFREGQSQFKDEFVPALKKDLASLDYPVDDIFIGPPITLRIQIKEPSQQIYCLQVRETGLSAVTDQYGMSDGMYRAIALLIHVNLALLRKSATTMLIDDIGEGLDFDRSIRLIELLRAKADASALQLVITTNDRFVMNHVPLEEWTVLQREQQAVRVRNYSNSREHFDQFKLTGLSNFSFFEMNAEQLASVDVPSDADDEEYDNRYFNDKKTGGDDA